jgi:hypothetical protein
LYCGYAEIDICRTCLYYNVGSGKESVINYNCAL